MEQVDYALIDGHRVIIGPGIDHVLEGIDTIILLDDYYADIYGDYLFLGYNVYHVPLDYKRSDFVNLYTVAQLMNEHRAVVVCGEEPARCLYAIAAYLVYARRINPEEAVARAASIIRQIYRALEPRARNKAADAALNALYRSTEMLEAYRLSLLMSLASNYGWGWGDVHYSEHVSWTAALGADNATLLASLLHFLVEGPGSEEELLRVRLETLGTDKLRDAIDAEFDKAIDVLWSYARRGTDRRAALLRFIEELEPGKGYILLAMREDDNIVVYCRGSEGIPDRECVERVQRAAAIARESLGSEPRIQVADWL